MGWTGVVTDAGMALLAQWSGGGHTLTLTKANVGSGTVDAEDLHAATNISSYQANASIVNAKDVGSGMKFKLQVGPSSGSAYTAHQIGIWGKLDSGAETLISIHQDSDTGVSVPAASTSADFAFVLYVTLAISNSEDLTVTLDSAAYVSQSDLNDAVDALKAVATSRANGMMSAADKVKLDGIEAQANKYVHPSDKTASAGVPTANQTPGFGATFNVDQVANDNNGHVTGHTTRTVKIPNAAATQSVAGLMSAADKTKLDGVAAGANAYVHPSYPARTGKPTGNQTPGFGGGFTMSQITSDAQGHVTGATDRTVKIPNATATTSEAGLMSATDKSKLDGIATGANKYVHPADKTASSGVPTTNQTPGFGSTFNVDQIANDNNGHVTGHTTRTVKIPNATATADAAGLMSAADKTKLDGASASEDVTFSSIRDTTNTQSTGTGGYLRRRGSIVCVSFQAKLQTNTSFPQGNSGVRIATLPENLRPSAAQVKAGTFFPCLTKAGALGWGYIYATDYGIYVGRALSEADEPGATVIGNFSYTID